MSESVAYALTAFIAFMAVVKVFFQNDFIKKYSRSTADMAVYIGVMFALVSVFLAFFLDFSALPHLATVILAAVWGLLTAICQITYSKAMNSGPVSLTVLITNFSIVIPIIYGVFAWNNTVTSMQWIGLGLIAVAFVLVLYKKDKPSPVAEEKSSEEGADRFAEDNKTPSVAKNTGMNALWIVMTIVTLAGFGVSSVLSTQQQLMYPNELSWFVFLSYATAAVFMAIFVPLTGKKVSLHPDKRMIADMVFGAAALGLHNYLRPRISIYLPQAVFQPLASILNIIFITLFGLVAFKDKIGKMQWVGIAVSSVAIVLLCL